MKKVKLNSLKYLFFAIIISLAACKGDKGEAGPAGPTGATGATGVSGSANVTSTNYTANPGSWNGSGGSYYINVPVAAITDETQDVVLVYVQTYTGGPWWALPTAYVIYPTDAAQFDFLYGQVGLYYYYTSAPTTTWYFRIVVIPPTAGRPAINYNDYGAVKSAFNLKD